ncbi:MAG: hypothetical protein MR485_05075 [Mollicutes bacterium]|nr:hypothetical protein [Mollicutes bacterium]
MAKFKMTKHNFNFIKKMFDGVDQYLRFERLTKNDIVVKRITKNISPTEAYDYFRVYSKHTDQLMFSCYDHWTLVNDHIIVVERKKREHIKNLFFSHNNIFNKKYECQRKDFKILYNFFFKPEKSLTVNC